MRNTFITLLAGLFFLSSPVLAEEPPVVEAVPEAVEAADAVEPSEAAPEAADAVPDAAEAAPEAAEAAEAAEAVPDAAEAVEDILEVSEEVSDEVSLLIEAVGSGSWPVAFGLLLTILVAVARKFALKDKLPGKYVPWVSIGMAVAASLGLGLSAGMAVGDAVMAGLAAGLAAIGGWEVLFKHVKALNMAASAE